MWRRRCGAHPAVARASGVDTRQGRAQNFKDGYSKLQYGVIKYDYKALEYKLMMTRIAKFLHKPSQNTM
jgi:hypothetical protein